MAAGAQAAVIEDLRARIRQLERRPARRPGVVSSGWRAVDALLPGGGFPRGAVSELSGGPASGKTAVALATLALAAGEGGVVAFVDGHGDLYPPAVASFGVPLERLLLVRPQGDEPSVVTRSALWAAEALLGSGAFEAVAIDAGAERMRSSPAVMTSMLGRLRSAAEKGGAVALWLGTPGGVRAPAAVRIELTPSVQGWRAQCAFARGDPVDDASGRCPTEMDARCGAALLRPSFLGTDRAA